MSISYKEDSKAGVLRKLQSIIALIEKRKFDNSILKDKIFVELVDEVSSIVLLFKSNSDMKDLISISSGELRDDSFSMKLREWWISVHSFLYYALLVLIVLFFFGIQMFIPRPGVHRSKDIESLFSLYGNICTAGIILVTIIIFVIIYFNKRNKSHSVCSKKMVKGYDISGYYYYICDIYIRLNSFDKKTFEDIIHSVSADK